MPSLGHRSHRDGDGSADFPTRNAFATAFGKSAAAGNAGNGVESGDAAGNPADEADDSIAKTFSTKLASGELSKELFGVDIKNRFVFALDY